MLLLRLSGFLVGLAVHFGVISVAQAATDCGVVTEIYQIECESLLQLYQSTNGAKWRHNEGWNVTNTPCGWFGVSCENNGVTVIQLTGNNLNGTLADFRGLPNLHRLSLGENQLTGTIHDFSGLPKLQWLHLYKNQLTGGIPNFSGLPNLQTLSLGGNQLTGAIPDFSGLPKLLGIGLYNNKLCKNPKLNYYNLKWRTQIDDIANCKPPTAAFTVSPQTGEAPLTVDLDASRSADYDEFIDKYEWTANGQILSGMQTSTTFTMHGEYTIVLAVTDIEGIITTTQKTVTVVLPPLCQTVTEISQRECESLLQLYQSTNGAQWLHNDGWNVTNTPCGWFGVSCENNGVTDIQLTGNNLNGTLPDFRGLPQLQTLYLSRNQLTGTVPDFRGLPQLLRFSLWDNELTGTIPDFSSLANLQGLSLSRNQLTGAIPDFSGLPQLQTLYLWSNELTGTIHDFSGLPQLLGLSLRGNQLTGTIPDFRALPKLQALYLGKNQLSGAIPDFSGLTDLKYLDLRNNKICKNLDINYAIWPIEQARYNDDTTWQAQLSGFPTCPVNK